MSLIEAVRTASPEVHALEREAHLVGFVGHEGRAPGFIEGLLGSFVHPEDRFDDPRFGDGKVWVWSLVYATPQGGLVQAVVDARSGDVLAEPATTTADPVIRQLWSLNMGGRLLIDSSAAVSVFARGDPTARSLLEDIEASSARDTRGGGTASGPASESDSDEVGVVYASSVVAFGTNGSVHDMVHEIYLSAAGNPSPGTTPASGDEATDTAPAPYDRFGQVRHDREALVTSGTVKPLAEGQSVVLVDERFTLGPLVPDVQQSQDLPNTVREVSLRLETDGVGTFRFRITSDDEQVVLIEDRALGRPVVFEEGLGTLTKGVYLVEAEATGNVEFRVLVTGLVGI